jgi:hypothetical protein
MTSWCGSVSAHRRYGEVARVARHPVWQVEQVGFLSPSPYRWLIRSGQSAQGKRRNAARFVSDECGLFRPWRPNLINQR